jgi:DNA-binding response OmpR family regulator
MRILIIEDEKKMAALLRQGLTEENHCISLAYDGPTALEMSKTYDFDAIILDVMLPGVDGLEVARRLRKENNHTPILMLTARDAVPDITNGLDSGADDYLTKPFAFEELLARLRAITRRGTKPRPSRLQVADLVLDPATRQVFRSSRELHLTATEYRVVEFLMRRAGRVLSRTALVEAVWGLDQDVEDNTLDAFISSVRTKIDKGFRQKLIHTVRSVGYCLRETRTR